MLTMTDGLSLRDRKKALTRRNLARVALNLFSEKGFAETTVAEIAAAAQVSTKTFFNYFSSKEDVAFADFQQRMELTLGIIAEYAEQETVPQLLQRICDAALNLVASEESVFQLADGTARRDLILREPALRARSLELMHKGQREIARTLAGAYPDVLNEVTAAAVIGGYIGAIQAAMMVCLERGDDIRDAMPEAMAAGMMIMRGLQNLE